MNSGVKRTRVNEGEERVVLNVGGFKFETYRSTLTAYPDTFLGAMFQERNQMMLHPNNGNEYFFDRNGRAFHYVMEFYRTGKVTWVPTNYQHQHLDNGKTICFTVNKQELDKELDYFQIPIISTKLQQIHTKHAKDINKLVDDVISVVYEGMELWEDRIIIYVYKNKGTSHISFVSQGIYREMKVIPAAFNILNLLQDKFGEKLKASIKGLQYELDNKGCSHFCLKLIPSYELSKYL